MNKHGPIPERDYWDEIASHSQEHAAAALIAALKRTGLDAKEAEKSALIMLSYQAAKQVRLSYPENYARLVVAELLGRGERSEEVDTLVSNEILRNINEAGLLVIRTDELRALKRKSLIIPALYCIGATSCAVATAIAVLG